MKRIINIITYETVKENCNGFDDTINIVYSVCFDDTTTEEYTGESVPDEVYDYLYYAECIKEEYTENNTKRERLYIQ